MGRQNDWWHERHRTAAKSEVGRYCRLCWEVCRDWPCHSGHRAVWVLWLGDVSQNIDSKKWIFWRGKHSFGTGASGTSFSKGRWLERYRWVYQAGQVFDQWGRHPETGWLWPRTPLHRQVVKLCQQQALQGPRNHRLSTREKDLPQVRNLVTRRSPSWSLHTVKHLPSTIWYVGHDHVQHYPGGAVATAPRPL